MSLSLRLIPLVLTASLTSLSAQVSTPTTPVVRKGSSPAKEADPKAQPALSERARQFAESLTDQDEDYTAWSRSVLRLLERKERANAPLFYPEVTTAKQGNLFALLFRLLSEGKITAYRYQDSQIAWDEAPQLTFAELLERFSIPATKDSQGKLQVALADIPSALVEGYYLREQSRFDERTSSFSTRPLALCPILSGIGDYGQVRLPLFWVSIEELRPYLEEKKVALSATNQARRASLADYFSLGSYRGDIIGGDGLPGQLAGDSTLQRAQRRAVEQQILQFERSLYLPDSILHPVTPSRARQKKSSRSTASTSTPTRSRDRRLRPSKASRPSAPASSSRSVRGRE